MPDILALIICGIAALAGGFIDAISGGGGMLTIPALLLCGISPHMALGTNKISAFLGTSVALFNFGKHGLVHWRMAAIGVPFSLIGSWLGALLALHLPHELLGKIIVALLPVAMVVTILPQKTHQYDIPLDKGRLWLALPCVCVLMGVYDGFFGPGTGSLLILLLHWCLRLDLVASSATAKAFNLASNVSAAVLFVAHDSVLWGIGLVMAACFMTGNWIGSTFAIRSGAGAVRKFLIISLLLLMASLIWQYFLKPT